MNTKPWELVVTLSGAFILGALISLIPISFLLTLPMAFIAGGIWGLLLDSILPREGDN